LTGFDAIDIQQFMRLISWGLGLTGKPDQGLGNANHTTDGQNSDGGHQLRSALGNRMSASHIVAQAKLPRLIDF